MEFQLTPGAHRAILEATWWSSCPHSTELEAPALLLGLLNETECRAATMLGEQAIDLAAVNERWPAMLRRAEPLKDTDADNTCSEGDGPQPLPRFNSGIRDCLLALFSRLGYMVQPLTLTTELVLLALTIGHDDVALWLRERGISDELIEADVCRQLGIRLEPLADDPIDFVDDTLPCPATEPAQTAAEPFDSAESLAEVDQPIASGEPSPELAVEAVAAGPPAQASTEPATGRVPYDRLGILRVIDAAANRAREGLRVVEDYVRFVLDDRHLTGQLKQLRHGLTASLESISTGHLLAARETLADVGTTLATPAEGRRADARAVVTANFVRLQESLRSLEEYSKVINPCAARHFEKARYETYTLQRAVEITLGSAARLRSAQLYVLLDGRQSEAAFCHLVEAIVTAGADILQLRDKQLDDRSLLGRAALLRRLTRDTRSLFVVNDRPDIAAVTEADGVHVGQSELAVKDARRIVGPDALVGVSTHSIAEARQAVLDGANYIGVGPVFPSTTKQFERFAGLELLGKVAREIRLPAFAIGGIGPGNARQVVEAGCCRIAVSGAVLSADNPAAVIAQLRAALPVAG